jgi:hypothetical protein
MNLFKIELPDLPRGTQCVKHSVFTISIDLKNCYENKISGYAVLRHFLFMVVKCDSICHNGKQG